MMKNNEDDKKNDDHFMDALLNLDPDESKQLQLPDVIINDEKDIWW